jgi:hypothetical protein
MILYESSTEFTRQTFHIQLGKDEMREGVVLREKMQMCTTESMTEHQIINWQEKNQLQTSDRVCDKVEAGVTSSWGSKPFSAWKSIQPLYGLLCACVLCFPHAEDAPAKYRASDAYSRANFATTVAPVRPYSAIIPITSTG